MNDKDLWTLCELFKSFYSLKEVAELYKNGCAGQSNNPCANLIKNSDERDRGEELTISTHGSVYEFEKSNCLESYNYLFDSGYWFVLGAGSTWLRLTDEIVKNGLPE